MSNIKTLNTDSSRLQIIKGGGGGGTTDMELSERVSKIESLLPNLVTREDTAREFGLLRADLHKEVGGLRAELQKEVGGLRSDLHKEIGGLHKELNAQTWRFVGAVCVICSALTAAVFFIAKNIH